MKVQDIIEMNKHDKQTIYEAYSIEVAARTEVSNALKQAERRMAEMRFENQAWQDAWLEQNIRSNVEVTGDKEAAISEYFAHPNRWVLFTDDLGYYAGYETPEELFIMFAWTNPKAWSRERKNMVKLIKYIAGLGKPVRYTGKFDVMKRHSKEIEEGLYELTI